MAAEYDAPPLSIRFGLQLAQHLRFSLMHYLLPVIEQIADRVGHLVRLILHRRTQAVEDSAQSEG